MHTDFPNFSGSPAQTQPQAREGNQLQHFSTPGHLDCKKVLLCLLYGTLYGFLLYFNLKTLIIEALPGGVPGRLSEF